MKPGKYEIVKIMSRQEKIQTLPVKPIIFLTKGLDQMYMLSFLIELNNKVTLALHH